MGSFSGPKIASNGLVLGIDANNQKSIAPLGCTGFSGAAQLIKNLVSSGDVIGSTTGLKLDNLSFYTAFAIDYPEGSYGGDAAGRQGITPGFNVRSGTKLYDASRALHLWVWNNDTSSWVADSYFNGLRLAGHCYDNFSGAGITGTELGLFVSNYNTIKNIFPNCTYIVSGGHRADTYNVTVRNIFTDLGMPSGYIDSDFVGAPEWILVGKPGLGQGNAYGWAYQNYPTNTTEVAHLNFGLPIYQGTNNYLGFNGTTDFITTNYVGTSSAFTYEVFLRSTDITKDQMYIGYNTLTAHYVRIVNSRAFLSVSTTTAQRTFHDPQILSNNTNYHIVSCYNGVQHKIYINGVLSTGSVLNEPLSGWGTSRIGRWQDEDQRSFVGNISTLKTYNRELSANEVQQNFNALRGRFGI